MQVSIVVPVYRSADCLPELVRRVHEDVGAAFDSYELVLVNDGSPDDSWAVIERLCDHHDFITGINLRTNVGQDNALMAGLSRCRGDIVVIMDDDLQHDPADVVRLCREIEHGHDVVYARFEEQHHPWWKRAGSWLANRMAVWLLHKPPDIYMSPFKAMRREVAEEILGYPGPFSYVDGIVFGVTSNLAQIPATHGPRHAGTSSYTLARSIGVWLRLVTGFSAVPLRVVSIAGGVMAGLSFAMGAYFLVEALLFGRPVEGWPSLMVTVAFLGGIQLIAIGVVGEYIARIYLTINKRPQYSVQQERRASTGADGRRDP